MDQGPFQSYHNNSVGWWDKKCRTALRQGRDPGFDLDGPDVARQVAGLPVGLIMVSSCSMMLIAARQTACRWVQAMDSLWDRRQQRYCRCGEGSKILSSGRVVNSGDAGNVVLGKWTWLAGELLVYPHGGRIDIGDHCYVGEGTRIWSLSNVRSAAVFSLSHGVNVHDNDAHLLSAAELPPAFPGAGPDGARRASWKM